MMILQMSIYARPVGFDSPVLKNALRQLRQAPYSLSEIGAHLVTSIKYNLAGRMLHKRTGTLYNSWAWEMQIVRGGWRLVTGSDCAYARIHNFGGWTGAGHATYIPARPYVDVAIKRNEKFMKRILREYMSHIFTR